MRARIGLAAGLALAALPWTIPQAASSGSPAGPVSVRIEVEGWSANLKKDLKLKVQFTNRAEPVVMVDGMAFSAESFSIRKPGRKPIRPSGEIAGIPKEPVKLDGYGAIERVVNLSEAFPKLTSGETTWEIGWSHGDWTADSVTVKVVRPFDPKKDRKVIVETDLGKMTWTLMPESAPRHVERFVNLVREGYYDGLTFFRLIPGLHVEGGDPAGDGSGGWERQMMGEFSDSIQVVPGLVAGMRRESSMTSESMFFITLGNLDFMRGKHTFFARITEGFPVLSQMNGIENRGDSGLKDAFMLVPPVKIHRMTVRK